ncbi:hypothetical protein ABKN59_003413 [Abortiporus biennis]
MNEGGTLANESKSADSADTIRKEKAKVLERIRSRINSEREWWKDMRNMASNVIKMKLSPSDINCYLSWN